MSKSSDGFVSLITWVSVAGVALGVMALTSVTSVINGFEGELARVMTSVSGHVVLYTRGNPVGDPERIEAKIRKSIPEVHSVAESFQTQMMLAGPSGVSGAVLDGANLPALETVVGLSRSLKKGTLPSRPGELVLGHALAEKIGVSVGSSVRVIAPFVGQGFEGGENQSKVEEFKVTGILQLGMHDYDSKYAFASLRDVQQFLEQPGNVTNFRIRLQNGADAQAVAERLSDVFGFPFRVRDWGSLNSNLL